MLRSGGPLMTVQACSLNLAYCRWFEQDSARDGTFEIAVLVRADVQEPLTSPAAIGALKAALAKSAKDKESEADGPLAAPIAVAREELPK